MRRDLEQKYLELQAGPRKVFFSPLPADAEIHAVGTIVDDEDDDDFVLEPAKPEQPTAETSSSKPEPDAKAEAPSGDTAAPPAEGAATNPPPAAAGGDALLDIALREEIESLRKQSKSRRMTGGARTASGFVIFCPYGCKIEVKEAHRGMTGKCPKCRAPFLVPVDPPDYSVSKKEAAAAAEKATAAAAAPGGFQIWLADLHVHTISPEKLKLKADSLLKDFVEKDFGFSSDRMAVVSFAKKAGGLFGGGDKKKGDPRELMLAHLREGKSADDLPVAEKQFFPADDVRQMRIVQPAASRMDSMFHGVPVFGAHRIAVQLPVKEWDPQFVSFALMKFREFSQALQETYGMADFGADLGIPLKDEYQTFKCLSTEVPIKALKNAEWYQADPSVKVTLVGWKCDGCGLAITETARKKEKLGGSNGKGLAKALCPKCKKKFGEHPLYTLPDDATAPAAPETSPAAEEKSTTPEPAAAT
jgi:hypothetical protein